ncbi:MAG: branched-chain amino acid transport system II carrier protein [Tissierellia bacterium]|nr:branched-chain amino acid transport system II carrier protein [Tissierellia bacterium]
MKKKTVDTLVIGFALFSMFFGAGNLIFPPTLGLMAGSSWMPSTIGFILSGVFLTLICVIATAMAGGRSDDLGKKVGDKFAIIISTLIMLAIGPLLAIPRTGATTYEIWSQTILKGISPMVFSIIFFGLTFLFAINKNGVIDKIGKFLTPALVFVLAFIIIKGVFFPIGEVSISQFEKPFVTGFEEGYQTMDALAAVMFTSIVVNAILIKGYDDKKDMVSMATKAGIIAAIGLCLVYGGLTYIGAYSGVNDLEIARTKLLITITDKLWGNLGGVTISLAMGLACLTTAVGLTSTAGDFFSNMTKDRLSYKLIVTITCIFSGIFSTVGVSRIVNIAVPFLVTLYPIIIVLSIMALFDKYIPNRYFYLGAVSGTFLISIFDGLESAKPLFVDLFGENINHLDLSMPLNLIAKLPFANRGFPYILPAIIFALLFGFGIYRISKVKDDRF